MSNIKKLIEKLPDNLDLALVTSDINRRYLSGMKSSAGVLAVFKEKAYLLIDFRYYEKAVTSAIDCEVILLTDFSKQLEELCKNHNAKFAAVEADTLTISEFKVYQDKFSQLEFDSTETLSRIIRDLRAVKTIDEIESIKKAQRIAELAYNEILNFIVIGRTEKEIALELNNLMLKNGAEDISFDTIVLSGLNSSLPHGVPSDRKICDGEFVLMDFGAVYEGYHSDMTRTVCIGSPSGEMKHVYEIVKKAQEASFAVLKGGITGSALDNEARAIIEEAGYGGKFGHSLGHGVGMEIHEYPNAAPKSNTVFEENMIITVEPGIYIPGKFGVRIEDFAAIKNDGYDNLTKIPNNFIRI